MLMGKKVWHFSVLCHETNPGVFKRDFPCPVAGYASLNGTGRTRADATEFHGNRQNSNPGDSRKKMLCRKRVS